MKMNELEPLRFPIGRNHLPETVNPADRAGWISTIRQFPQEVEKLVSHLDEEHLHWIYRPEGWSIQQLVHHCADSHLNAFVRFKLTLTEATPRIRPYHEASWAQTRDVTNAPVSDSLSILTGLHHRWSVMLEHMDNEDFELEYLHPEFNREFSLHEALASYAWHCRHHLAHMKLALDTQGKYNG